MFKGQAINLLLQNIFVIVLSIIVAALYIKYSKQWLYYNSLIGVTALYFSVFLFVIYSFWAFTTINPFFEYQKKFLMLHELLFH